VAVVVESMVIHVVSLNGLMIQSLQEIILKGTITTEITPIITLLRAEIMVHETVSVDSLQRSLQ
jgi:hypothetical protein